MNKLDPKDRARILHMLCEGQSIRGIARIMGVSKNTISKLLVDAGKVCTDYHDQNVRGLQSKRVECDEIWSFCYAKQKNADKAHMPDFAGDVWTWTSIDADSKLIINWFIGGRDAEYADYFMKDLADRLENRVQLTTDGHKAYLKAVDDAFGDEIDYAQLVKLYGQSPNGKTTRYSPAQCTGIKKKERTGTPDEKYISTSYVERQNLTMRMHMRRFTRLTNAFSKKIENHCYAVALHFMYYNFVKIHSTLKETPAMAAGVTDRLWEISDIVKLLEEKEAAEFPKVRGPYKKEISN